MKNLDTPAVSGDLDPQSAGCLDHFKGRPLGVEELAMWNAGFTKRERACIDLRIPETDDPELNALIEKARRQEFAAKAMQAMLANQSIIDTFGGYREIAGEAETHADSLVEQLERTNDQH